VTFSAEFKGDAWRERPAVRRFAQYLDATGDGALESMAQEARAATLRHFGKTIRLFAPLYLSNECINNCSYCGFSRDNPILRVTLTPEQTEAEARHLVREGFRSILLVAGEHPKFVSDGYLEEVTRRLHTFVPALSLEVGPMEREHYEPLVRAGAEGLVVYQETYDRGLYATLHTAGPKRDFDWRLDCPERAAAAGFRRVGIGALFGLAAWREEAVALAGHVDHLLRTCWKSFITVPRLRPAAGEFEPLTHVTDRDLVRMICAFRLAFPQIGIVVSTREQPALRDKLVPLGVTHMSAGARTEPGGYTGAGANELHTTVRGRQVALVASEGEHRTATEQFAIADERSADAFSRRLKELGYDPVWKDWDSSLTISE
jgi:2-iminoacetate synthase